MTSLHFNYKDVFRACRLGFSTKKIWVQFIGLLVAFVGYGVLTYLAHLAARSMDLSYLARLWDIYRWLPGPLVNFPWYSWVIWAAGVVFFVLANLVAGTAISKLTFEQLRGDEFFEVKEATKFAFRNIRAVIFSPVLLILFAAILILCGLVLSLIGAIPYFGPIFVGVMAIPAFAVALFIVYLMVVFCFNLVIGPAVVGTTRSDTFDTLFEVFSCVNEQPWRLVLYNILLKVLGCFATLVLGAATIAAVALGTRVVAIFQFLNTSAPSAFARACYNALHFLPWYVPDRVPLFVKTGIVNLVSFLGLRPLYPHFYYVPIGWAGDVFSVLLGITAIFILLFVLSYGGAIWFSGNTLIYAVLVRKKDDKNLLEVKDREEEPAPAPCEPSAEATTEKEKKEEPKPARGRRPARKK